MTFVAPGKSHTRLDELSDSSRVWVFGAANPLNSEQALAIANDLREFLSSWKAHGQPLRAAVEIRDRRFIIIAADDSADPSGCSIDSLFARLAGFQKAGANLLDSTLVFYRTDGGEIKAVDRPAFRQLVRSGEIHSATSVFDLTPAALGDVRRGLEKRITESWHGAAFGL